MSREARSFWAAALSCAVLLGGCHATRKFYFFKPKDLEHYRQVAAEIEEPCEPRRCCPPLAAARPVTIENIHSVPSWDLSLDEALTVTLSHSDVVRQLSPVGGPPNTLLAQPQAVTTIYDPAIQASSPGNVVGGQGVEAALSAFDAQLNASMFWERRERPINVGGPIGQAIFAANAEQDLGTFQAELSKFNVAGGQTFARHNVNYDLSNSPTRAVASAYDANFEIGVAQPLLQGAGTSFNRIAGPGGQPGFYGGVLVARINHDLSLADFERAVRNLVRDVENAYWDLYVAYRTFDSVKKGRDSALENWRDVKEIFDIGGGVRDITAANVAQARSQYFQFRAELESALCNLLAAENRLRYLMGLSPTDGRILRPADEPTMAKVVFEWDEILIEALARRVELRKQKWVMKQKELELIAARNFLLPRLDGVALYRWLGAGDTLIDPKGRGVFPFEGSNAYSTITSGDYQEWQMGFRLSMPLGFRRELASLRNAQWQLCRERARLRGQELEVSHGLTDAVRNLHCNHTLARTRFDNWVAREQEYQVVKAFVDVGKGVFSDLLQADANRAVAEVAYYRSLVDYNLAIMEVHFRKGSLLEYDQVYLAEGPWPKKAYLEARRKARLRAHSLPLDYTLRQHPGVISRGVYGQRVGAPVPTDAVIEHVEQPAPVEDPSAKSKKSGEEKSNEALPLP